MLFLSCQKAAELIEKNLYFRLSFKERLQLKAHKAMCDACSTYEKQSYLMDKVLRHHSNPVEPKTLDVSQLKMDTLDKIA